VKPDLADLPEWGVKLFVLKQDRGKLEPKADEGRWVGYSAESKGHRVYWPGKRRVTVERNVMFDETVLITPDDTQTEGEPITQNNRRVTPHNQPPPQPPEAPTARIDPLDEFESSGPPAEQLQGKGHRVRKLSAYVRGISEGTGSSTGHANAPAYPRGLPMPTESSALAAVVE
jgi:hypothetical protein